MKNLISKEKALVASILSIIPGVELGLVKAKKVDGKIVVTYQIKYDQELESSVKDVVNEFEDGSVKIDARILTSKYKFVDSVTRAKINKLNE
ncbi:hypothetical protein [Sutcliffiella horikoshii]|uniref:hypothetical protein n=1 Tax=Sutcliffiella horikoshii TaxID=79883 RepID=UPI001F4232F1|nr:hypothetical protein [Sutcliffiella horikoshii]MCG1020782.1 hypothetical protein [Sutcliffiella horikoshii]